MTPFGDQRLHARIAFVEAERNLAAPRLPDRAARRAPAPGSAPRLRAMNSSDSSIDRARTASIVTPSQASSAASSAAQRDDRRRADPHPLDALRRPVVEIEGERALVADPARQGRPHHVGMLRRDIDEGRRARARH